MSDKDDLKTSAGTSSGRSKLPFYLTICRDTKMSENDDIKRSPETSTGRPKQRLVLLTILALTLVTATNKELYSSKTYSPEYYYKFSYANLFVLTVPAIGAILMLILTQWKGRRVLFMTLYILSILTSLIGFLVASFGLRYEALCMLLYAPVEGSSIALLYIVICEYCAPERRFLFLIANSAIQTVFYWITLVIQREDGLNFFVDYLQYFNIILGVFGLWSVFRWPESPYWLASKRRFEDCAKAFVEVRGRGSDTSEELRVLTDGRPRKGCVKMIYAPLLIALPALTMSTMNIDSINIYKMFLPFQLSDKYLIFLTLKCIAAVASVLTVFIPLELPRKVLFLSCGFFYASEFYVVFFNLKMKTPVLAVIFDVIVDYGPRTVALPLLFEIIPQKYVNLVTVFIIVITIVIEALFVSAELVLAGSPIVMLLVIISYFIMPEVKEKSLIEIEHLYVSMTEKPPQCIQTDL